MDHISQMNIVSCLYQVKINIKISSVPYSYFRKVACICKVDYNVWASNFLPYILYRLK